MKRIAWKFAASTAILGATTFSCMVNGVGTMPAAALQTDRADQQAAQLFQRAGRALADNKLKEAISLLEQAVILSPRDAGYRLLLADAYMKSGRFQSAEAAYRDVLELDPQRARAGLGLALMQVANGRRQEAISMLERLEGVAPAADLGLAYAIAGSPRKAVDVLEPAARSMGATARVRQNLALAYAMGGDWQRARTIAAQDVSPAELGERMTQWATIAQRSGAPDQVASLLGVSPVQDAGQPVQLALNAIHSGESAAQMEYAEAQPPMAVPSEVAVSATEAPVQASERPVIEVIEPGQPVEPQATVPMPTNAQPVTRIAFAEAAPAAPIAPSVEAAPAEAATPTPAAVAEVQPVAVAEVQPIVAPAVADAAATTEVAELDTPKWGVDERGKVTLPEETPVAEQAPARVQYAAAAENLVRPDPVVMPVANRAVRALAPVATRALRSGGLPGSRSPNGSYVVQIGAFSSAQNADRAWQTYEQRFGLKSEQPVTMTFDLSGRLLHRVAISGFVSRKEAAQVCTVIRVRGGECFVRSNAGDAATSWAARYTRRA